MKRFLFCMYIWRDNKWESETYNKWESVTGIQEGEYFTFFFVHYFFFFSIIYLDYMNYLHKKIIHHISITSST